MFCSKCGKKQPENANFCSRCGVHLQKPEPRSTVSLEYNSNNTDENSLTDNIDTKLTENTISDATNVPEIKENITINKEPLTENIDVKMPKNINSSTISVEKNKDNLSVFGILSLIFASIGLTLLITFFGINLPQNIYENLTIILPLYFVVNLVLNIIALYTDKNFARVLTAFYINITALLFILTYFCYVLLANI